MPGTREAADEIAPSVLASKRWWVDDGSGSTVGGADPRTDTGRAAMDMDVEHHLLPAVRHFARNGGDRVELHAVHIATCPDDPRVASAARRWSESVGGGGSSRGERAPRTGAASIALNLIVERGVVPHADGYRLEVRNGKVVVVGGSVAGCFYALQTLEQLAERHGQCTALPACTIMDWPDFETRGLLHDVTRGKVPTLPTLKLLADRLAKLKANQFQLYIEHAFAFSFNPSICDADHGLTPDEVRTLSDHCAERFIELVPAVANLGHMGRILSMPGYRTLAEIEPVKRWEDMNWPERARGFTLDCRNPKAIQLVERIWSEILDCFSSRTVNICGDEPWDLGNGTNRPLLSPREAGEAYLSHIRRVHEFCAERGRRTQFWSDVVRNHPELFDRVPRDSTILHWGYDDRSDYEGTRAFVETGLDTIVCPGTSGWKRIVNAVDLAERNVRTFAGCGYQYGAKGLLNTDWGDHGHFQPLATSWHGIALGAACAWRTDHVGGTPFDERFAGLGWGPTTADAVTALREASKPGESCETWRLFWTPLTEARGDATLPATEAADRARDAARALRRHLMDASPSWSVASEQDRRELLSVCDFVELFAEKVAIARGDRRVAASRDLREKFHSAWRSYEAAWRARNKSSGLADIESTIMRVATECGAEAEPAGESVALGEAIRFR